MKIIDYQKLTDRNWVNLFDITYHDRTGREKQWQVASRDAVPRCVSGHFEQPDAVLMIPFHRSENRLVLIREYRVPLAGYQYEFPAGLVDEGEGIEAAARRELKEETGLDLTRIHSVSPILFSTAGMTDESLVLIYCDCDGTPSSHENQRTEEIEVLLVSPDEAVRLLGATADKMDVKTWLALAQFTQHRFF